MGGQLICGSACGLCTDLVHLNSRENRGGSHGSWLAAHAQ